MTAETFPAAAPAQPSDPAPPAAAPVDPSLAVDPAVAAPMPPPRGRALWRIVLPAAALLAAGAFVLVTLHKPKPHHSEIYAPVTTPLATADAQAAAAKAKASAEAARASAIKAQTSAAKAPAAE